MSDYTDIEIMAALEELVPGYAIVWHGDSQTGFKYEDIDWLPQNTKEKPIFEDVIKIINRKREEYVTNEYQRQRALEYPSYADQFDLLYHGGYDVWKAKIDEIKNKYPKPESM